MDHEHRRSWKHWRNNNRSKRRSFSVGRPRRNGCNWPNWRTWADGCDWPDRCDGSRWSNRCGWSNRTDRRRGSHGRNRRPGRNRADRTHGWQRLHNAHGELHKSSIRRNCPRWVCIDRLDGRFTTDFHRRWQHGRDAERWGVYRFDGRWPDIRVDCKHRRSRKHWSHNDRAERRCFAVRYSGCDGRHRCARPHGRAGSHGRARTYRTDRRTRTHGRCGRYWPHGSRWRSGPYGSHRTSWSDGVNWSHWGDRADGPDRRQRVYDAYHKLHQPGTGRDCARWIRNHSVDGSVRTDLHRCRQHRSNAARWSVQRFDNRGPHERVDYERCVQRWSHDDWTERGCHADRNARCHGSYGRARPDRTDRRGRTNGTDRRSRTDRHCWRYGPDRTNGFGWCNRAAGSYGSSGTHGSNRPDGTDRGFRWQCVHYAHDQFYRSRRRGRNRARRFCVYGMDGTQSRNLYRRGQHRRNTTCRLLHNRNRCGPHVGVDYQRYGHGCNHDWSKRGGLARWPRGPNRSHGARRKRWGR